MPNSSALERVAEAIWRGTFPGCDPGHYDWAYGPEEGQWGRDTFRRMAQAAMDALELTEERHTYQNVEVRSEMGGEGNLQYGGQTVRSLGFVTESRLVSPWVRADGDA